MSANSKRVKIVSLVLMTAIVVHFFAPIVGTHFNIDNLEPLYAVPSLIPVLTLVFVWVVFEEGCRIPKWIVILVLVDISLTIWRTTQAEVALSF